MIGTDDRVGERGEAGREGEGVGRLGEGRGERLRGRCLFAHSMLIILSRDCAAILIPLFFFFCPLLIFVGDSSDFTFPFVSMSVYNKQVFL